MKTGTVYLIGAGPGDKGLITVKGKEILKFADVIVYDYLVNADLLKFAKSSSEVIYVGKKAGQKEMSQNSINSLLIKKAQKGKEVARLKGGDPFVFGRGGEEAEALQKRKIPFEIVPGVTSVSAVPAYAGISLTHRNFTSSFAVVTGHEDPSKDKSSIPWDSLSKIGTVVFLMGVKNIKRNMSELMKAGKNPDTPVAIITRGTYSTQSTLTGTIKKIADIVRKQNDITSPGIVVVGEVVKLRQVINWYETSPLFGKTIVVTRPKEQAEAFIGMLESKGAQVISFPTIEITPPKSFKAVDDAIKNISSYDWIIFTSVNGVNSFFDRIKKLNKDIRELHRAKIAAIGEITAKEVEKMGIKVDLVPDDYKAEGLIGLFKRESIGGKNVLLPRAKVARDILPETLKQMGANVKVVTAYITKKPSSTKTKAIEKLLNEKKIDLLTFTSSSTARNFFELIPNIKKKGKKPLIASIGPVTAETVSKFGYKSQIVPGKYTVEDLANEIVTYFGK